MSSINFDIKLKRENKIYYENVSISIKNQAFVKICK